MLDPRIKAHDCEKWRYHQHSPSVQTET